MPPIDELTDKQKVVYGVLVNADGPLSVRQVAHTIDTPDFGAPIMSGDEARGQLEALEAHGVVEQVEHDGHQAYQPVRVSADE